MSAFLAVLYGGVAYASFLATFLYAIGFVGNLVVPKSIDSGSSTPLSKALIVNLLLLGVFAVQHSVMARPAFKRWWTRIVPEPIERSTYVLASCVVLIALMALWQPLNLVIWNVTNSVGWWLLMALFGAGWLLVPLISMAISHWDLF